MTEHEFLAERFEAQRDQLRAVAFRMLGSSAEAEDAVQEAWIKASRSDTTGVENLGGWLTTVVGRVCLDMLRARKSRREEPLESRPEPTAGDGPEQEALLADSVGLALLVVLETLAPAERLAFVLHDLFAVPFDDIAPIVGRTPAAARQLASRARRRVRSADAPETDLTRRRKVVDAFLAAARDGDFEGLVAVLDPDAVARSAGSTVRGAAEVAASARFYAQLAQVARRVLVDGDVGLAVLEAGRPVRVLAFTIAHDRITAIDVYAGEEQLEGLEVEVLGD
ncbi:sigma-70 family RNA polymerase sigma factor [Streptomyces cavernae]|uniref:sigma-70 family RNA polymerase sigma factor n=1 Tax=Streptomyces cavernae TaxID=2259034 RepID=UPI000FEBAD84|nr:sigma-70 family RNA polymerase sigma factor [Streptomyces cavernae]